MYFLVRINQTAPLLLLTPRSESRDEITIPQLRKGERIVINLESQEALITVHVTQVNINNSSVNGVVPLTGLDTIQIGSQVIQYDGTSYLAYREQFVALETFARAQAESLPPFESLTDALEHPCGSSYKQPKDVFDMRQLTFQELDTIQSAVKTWVLDEKCTPNALATLNAKNDSLNPKDVLCPFEWAQVVDTIITNELAFRGPKDLLRFAKSATSSRRLQVSTHGSVHPLHKESCITVAYMLDLGTPDLAAYILSDRTRDNLRDEFSAHRAEICDDQFIPTVDDLNKMSTQVFLQRPGEWVVIPPKLYMFLSLSSACHIITWQIFPAVGIEDMITRQIPEMRAYNLREEHCFESIVLAAADNAVKNPAAFDLESIEMFCSALDLLAEELRVDQNNFKILQTQLQQRDKISRNDKWRHPSPMFECYSCGCSPIGRVVEIMDYQTHKYICVACAMNPEMNDLIVWARDFCKFYAIRDVTTMAVKLRQRLPLETRKKVRKFQDRLHRDKVVVLEPPVTKFASNLQDVNSLYSPSPNIDVEQLEREEASDFSAEETNTKDVPDSDDKNGGFRLISQETLDFFYDVFSKDGNKKRKLEQSANLTDEIKDRSNTEGPSDKDRQNRRRICVIQDEFTEDAFGNSMKAATNTTRINEPEFPETTSRSVQDAEVRTSAASEVSTAPQNSAMQPDPIHDEPTGPEPESEEDSEYENFGDAYLAPLAQADSVWWPVELVGKSMWKYKSLPGDHTTNKLPLCLSHDDYAFTLEGTKKHLQKTNRLELLEILNSLQPVLDK